jgi:hypothetical protein
MRGPFEINQLLPHLLSNAIKVFMLLYLLVVFRKDLLELIDPKILDPAIANSGVIEFELFLF